MKRRPKSNAPVPLNSWCVIRGQTYVVTEANDASKTIFFRALYGNQRMNRPYSVVKKWVENDSVSFQPRASIESQIVLRRIELSESDNADGDRRAEYYKSQLALGGSPSKAMRLRSIDYVHQCRNEKLARKGLPLESKPHLNAVYKWIRLVDQYNGLIAALYFRCHRKDQREKRLDPLLERVVQKKITQIYKQQERLNKNDVYHAVSAFVSEFNKRAIRYGYETYKRPSRKTIEARINSMGLVECDLTREGKRYVDAHYNSGWSTQFSPRIGARAEADTNEVDCMVYDWNLDIEYRPALMIIVDCYTRCIIGWEISMLNKGTEKTLRTISHAIDKNNAKACRPEILFVDNGPEFINLGLQQTAQQMSMIIDFASPYSPNLKAICERLFGTLNSLIYHKAPGTTKESPKARGHYDSEGNAVLSIEKLTAFTQKAVDIYHQKVHSELWCSPQAAWDAAIETHCPVSYEPDTITAIVGIPHRCSINKGRVSWKGLYWHAPEMTEVFNPQPGKDPNKNANRKVDLVVNPADLSKVHVIHPGQSGRPIPCAPCKPALQNGLTASLWEALKKRWKDRGLNQASDEDVHKMRNKLVVEMLAEARNAKKGKTKRRRAAEAQTASREQEYQGHSSPRDDDPAAHHSQFDVDNDEFSQDDFGVE